MKGEANEKESINIVSYTLDCRTEFNGDEQ